MVPPESSLLWSLQPVCSLSTPAISILHCTQSFSHPAFEFYGIGLVEMTVGERRSMIVSFSSLKMRLTFQEYFEGLNDEGRHAQRIRIAILGLSRPAVTLRQHILVLS
eukprot:m.107870 g.107870  ORF g.107870 m.107870 type:complete len:108 (-) comp9233_c1_seq2:66-389(-)